MVPFAAPSVTRFGRHPIGSAAVGAWLTTSIVKLDVLEAPEASPASDDDRVLARDLVVEERAVGDGDETGRGVDGETAAGVVGKRIGDRRRR